jgi:hypothetical protein
VFINPPECVLGIVRAAILTRRSGCTPSFFEPALRILSASSRKYFVIFFVIKLQGVA